MSQQIAKKRLHACVYTMSQQYDRMSNTNQQTDNRRDQFDVKTQKCQCVAL